MRFAVAVFLAAAAACDSFTAQDPAQLTFGGLEADSADGTGDGVDVLKHDTKIEPDSIAVDGSSDTDSGDIEDVVQIEEVNGSDGVGEEVASDGDDTPVLVDADTSDIVDDAIELQEVVALDATDATTDDADSTEDVPDVEEPPDILVADDSISDDASIDATDGNDIILTDTGSVDGVDADDTIVTPPDDIVVTDVVPPDDVGTDPLDTVVPPDDTEALDAGSNEVTEPPDVTVGEDIPVVDKCLGVLCDTSDPCAPESCDSTTGACVVSTPALADNVGCEDGDFCTVGDVCDAGVCLSGAVDPEVCQCTTTSDFAHLEDTTLCTKPVTCIANVCVLGALVHCEDGNPCSYDLCVAQTGLCSFPTVPACCRQNEECDDGNTCTQNWCELSPGPDQNMCFSKNLDMECDDGDVCTVGDHCDINSGVCVAGNIAECDDGDPCTHSDTCFSGSCVGKALDCSDNDPCTQGEGCAGGACVTPTQADCSDSDVCTLDACVPGAGCTHSGYEPFVVTESASMMLASGGFQTWISADAGFTAGLWCAVGNACDKEIGIQLTGDSASLTIDLAKVGDTIGVPKVLEFTLQHHYDIVGVAFPTMEIRLDGNVIDSNVFDGPSEKYSRLQSGGTQPPLNLGATGTVVITLKRNGAKVSTSPVFQQTFHFIGEIIIRDACH